MKVVISIGGSLLTRELTANNFKKYANVALKLWKRGHKLIIVCGGGKTAREYISISKQLHASRDLQDYVGTMATHITALTLFSALEKNGYMVMWKHLKEAKKEVKRFFGKKIIITGGYDPRVSTDYDSVEFAKLVHADIVINASNVDGVYSDNPFRNLKAKKFKRLSYDQFIKIVKKNPQSPGQYRLFDLSAAKLIKKFKLKTIIINGNNPQEIVRAVNGKHHGTVID